jgi:hypothetical protein
MSHDPITPLLCTQSNVAYMMHVRSQTALDVLLASLDQINVLHMA